MHPESLKCTSKRRAIICGLAGTVVLGSTQALALPPGIVLGANFKSFMTIDEAKSIYHMDWTERRGRIDSIPVPLIFLEPKSEGSLIELTGRRLVRPKLMFYAMPDRGQEIFLASVQLDGTAVNDTASERQASMMQTRNRLTELFGKPMLESSGTYAQMIPVNIAVFDNTEKWVLFFHPADMRLPVTAPWTLYYKDKRIGGREIPFADIFLVPKR